MIFKYDFYLGNKKYIKNQALVSYVQLTNIIDVAPTYVQVKRKRKRKKREEKQLTKHNYAYFLCMSTLASLN
jgi:hypothetical protein